MEYKHIIESEMVDNFANMLMSEDKGDISLALEILNNRDTESVESEEQYHRLMSLIVKDKELFPSKSLYVIKIKGRILVTKGKAIFFSESDAKKYLSLHLTSKIGSNPDILPYRGQASPYLKAIKNVFKTGNKMRDFLIQNDLVEIINIA
jgi:hypothetical protein